MFDHFLSSILQVIIVIDVLGAIGYFVLGGLKHRNRKTSQAVTQEPSSVEVVPLHQPFWKRFWVRRSEPVPATEGDFAQLRNILFSFREELA